MNLWGFQCCNSSCGFVFEVKDSDNRDEDIHHLENIIDVGLPDCPRCSGRLQIMFSEPDDLNITKLFRLTPKDLWSVINGLGSAEEQVKNREVVLQKLIGGRVSNVEADETPSGRCIIRSIELDSGVTLHFAVGYGEAVVYKITTKENDHVG